MKTTLMQRMASVLAMSAVMAIGHPASAEQRVETAGQARARLEGVTLARVPVADPTGLDAPGEHASPGPRTVAAVSAVGPQASVGGPDAVLEGIVLPRIPRADPARLDRHGTRASVGLATRDAGGAQPAWFRAREERDRRITVGLLIGAGIGGALGALVGNGWCANEGGTHCPLAVTFGMQGALAGGGIGAVLGALGVK